MLVRGGLNGKKDKKGKKGQKELSSFLPFFALLVFFAVQAPSHLKL
jgi:hypothetical protein